MKLGVVQLSALLFGILYAMSHTQKDDVGIDYQ